MIVSLCHSPPSPLSSLLSPLSFLESQLSMLASRTTICPRVGFNVTSSAARWYHPTAHILYRPLVGPQSNSWRARLWFRPDGTPRSKWKGVFYGEFGKNQIKSFRYLIYGWVPSTVTTATCLYWVLVESVEVLENELVLVLLLSEMTRLDGKFSSYDLSKSQDVRSYLAEIVKCLAKHKALKLDPDFFQAINTLMDHVPEFHDSLRSELETIHNLILSKSNVSPEEAAEVLGQGLTDMSIRLIKVLQEAREPHSGGQLAKAEEQGEEDARDGRPSVP
ncbi:hypothetical protein D9756_006257 [Leucocoprinus leucothites]|uniref:Uncharacterized protein n=1 Tax=Leucocoprinus leucothites TaxID=201217 RepID=A0A8H5D4E2_9AGAR|nr:hypothetical protein D9756_006257 [Leucoagaricus leucothites]